MDSHDLKFFGLLATGVAVALLASAWLADTRCSATAQAMGVEHRWGIFTGCMIKHNKRFIPLKNYREFQ